MTGDIYNVKIQQFFFSVFKARQVLALSSSSSRACSKRVLNQTALNLPDSLVVLVVLLTHKFLPSHLPHSWEPQSLRFCALVLVGPLLDSMQLSRPDS